MGNGEHKFSKRQLVISRKRIASHKELRVKPFQITAMDDVRLAAEIWLMGDPADGRWRRFTHSITSQFSRDVSRFSHSGPGLHYRPPEFDIIMIICMIARDICYYIYIGFIGDKI